MKYLKENGETLKKTMVNFAKHCYTALIKQMQDATQLF